MRFIVATSRPGDTFNFIVLVFQLGAVHNSLFSRRCHFSHSYSYFSLDADFLSCPFSLFPGHVSVKITNTIVCEKHGINPIRSDPRIVGCPEIRICLRVCIRGRAGAHEGHVRCCRQCSQNRLSPPRRLLGSRNSRKAKWCGYFHHHDS